ncbi:MAG: hypothetical protein ABIP61_14705, partial [Burkholderiaceae bacterium]
MSTLTLIEPNVSRHHLDGAPTLLESIGFELGWDYAHYRVAPPQPYGTEASALRDGLLAGQAAFGARTLRATRHASKWLQLRLHAWLRGRSVELIQVTPNYLQQIDVTHCPITRVALSSATLEASDTSVDRVRNDAGYAAGNLAVMSARANHAKAACGFREALGFMQRSEAQQASVQGATGNPSDDSWMADRSHVPQRRAAEERHGLRRPRVDAGRALHGLPAAERGDEWAGLTAPQGVELYGLTAAQWARVAVLCSFVEPLEHLEACALPLLVLPPNRLRLFNPVQALQAFVSRQLLEPGWSQRVSRFEDLLPGKALQRDFKSFFMALLPRVLEAGRALEGRSARWAIEDAWRCALVRQRWLRFARQLSAAQCEALLQRAAARRLGTGRIQPLSCASATEGWNLATR